MREGDFAAWLQEQLDRRGWSQMDLVNHAAAQGYKITSSQVSRIINREQEGGLDAAIAIAHGLGVPRQEVFVARGWLPSEAQTQAQAEAWQRLSPEVLTLAAEFEGLPLALRRVALRIARSTIVALRGDPSEE